MTWRLAESLETLRTEVNTRWPDRDKASDGTIGDPAHQARVSDHNPNAAGVVRAIDIDAGPGLNPTGAHAEIGRTVAEAARKAGLNNHPAMGPGSYVIYDHQIASANSHPAWSWRPYDYGDPHTSHPHVSCCTKAGHNGYDSTAPWGIWPVQTVHHDAPKRRRPTLWKSMTKARARRYRGQIRDLQRLLNDAMPNRPQLVVDGIFGKQTRRHVQLYRAKAHLGRPTTVAGPKVWRALEGK